MRNLRLLVPALVVLAFLSACGDDSDSDATPEPTATGAAALDPQVGGIDAAEGFLQQDGIDGTTGDFTDPRSCAEITDDTDGEFCIHEDFSTYAAGLVILRLARADDPQDKIWEMRLSLIEGRWDVTSVQPFGEGQ